MAMDRPVASWHPGQGAVSTHAQRILTKQRMELPSNRNGEVDWNTLGKILTAHILGEVLCSSYVDYKYGQRTPEFDAVTDWEYAYEEKGIVVLKKQFPGSSIHCFMGRGVIDLPMDEIASFIVLPETTSLYDKFNVETRFIEVLSDTKDVKDVIIYRKCEAKHCLVKTVRDFVFYMRAVHMNGKYIQTTTSVDYDKCPPVPGVTRGELHPGSGWVLEPYNGDETKTLVTYLAHADFVNLSSVITNRVLRRQPLCIHYVRQHLMNKIARNSDIHTGMNQSSDTHCHNWSERLYEDPLPVVAFTTRRRTPITRSISHEELCTWSNRKPVARRMSSLPPPDKLVESQTNQKLAYLLQSNEEEPTSFSMSRSYNMTQYHPPLQLAEQTAVGYTQKNSNTFFVGDKHQNEPTGGKAPACERGEQLPDTSDQKT